jgi:3-hydroxymyristoyl/3-hydroxydecanoyl-(acyl carrier protein) dehydratase
MATAGLPHVYPFRFADTVLERPAAGVSGGRVRVRVTANGRAAMGEGWRSPLLHAEAIAQAALLLEGGDPASTRNGFLAGIDGFEAVRAPRAGETLEVRVRLTARFGAVVRFDGEVYSDGEAIARGTILVRKGESPAGPAVGDAG